MSLNLATYKSLGVIYKIYDTQLTKNGYPKREFILEIPTSTGQKAKTTLAKFLVLGDECGSLDFFFEGEFCEVMFRLDGKMWKKPETGEEILLQSLKVVDMHKRENPFETNEPIDDGPDSLSPQPIVDTATHVKDYINEPRQRDIFDDDEPDDLPF